jgi:hypothetical protein
MRSSVDMNVPTWPTKVRTPQERMNCFTYSDGELFDIAIDHCMMAGGVSFKGRTLTKVELEDTLCGIPDGLKDWPSQHDILTFLGENHNVSLDVVKILVDIVTKLNLEAAREDPTL